MTVVQLFGSGKASDEIVALYRAIVEQEVDNQPRFHPNEMGKLAAVISGRSFGPAIFELVHMAQMAAAISTNGKDYISIFWHVNPSRPNRFSHWVESNNSQNGLVVVDEKGLQNIDGTFKVTFSRMPFLAALMEFSATALGFDVISNHLDERDPGKAANSITRELNHWLNQHLPSAHEENKYHLIKKYLDRQKDIQILNDTVVFTLWQELSLEEDDFRTYKGVAGDALRFLRAWDAVDHGKKMYQANSLGTSREDGEVEVDIDANLWESVVNEEEPVSIILDTPPMNTIKLLTSTERKLWEQFAGEGKAGIALPKSILRRSWVGQWQGKISVAGGASISGQILENILTNGPQETPADLIAKLDRLQETINRARLTVFSHLWQLDRVEALHCLPEIFPDIDLRGLMKHVTEGENNNLLTILKSDPDQVPGLVKALNLAAKTAKKFQRKGLRPEDITDSTIQTALVKADSILIKLSKELELYRNRLSSHKIDNKEEYKIFSEQFRYIYRGTA
jgi:hypothetical protein